METRMYVYAESVILARRRMYFRMPLCMHICHASEGIHARNYFQSEKREYFSIIF